MVTLAPIVKAGTRGSRGAHHFGDSNGVVCQRSGCPGRPHNHHPADTSTRTAPSLTSPVASGGGASSPSRTQNSGRCISPICALVEPSDAATLATLGVFAKGHWSSLEASLVPRPNGQARPHYHIASEG